MSMQTLFGMSNRAYNILKWLTTIVLPAFGGLYFGLAGTWNLPNAEQVVGTITLLVTFFGVLLGISTKVYNNAQPDAPDPNMPDGEIMVDPLNPTEGTYVALDSSALEGKSIITLRVRDISSQ